MASSLSLEEGEEEWISRWFGSETPFFSIREGSMVAYWVREVIFGLCEQSSDFQFEQRATGSESKDPYIIRPQLFQIVAACGDPRSLLVLSMGYARLGRQVVG